MTRENKSGPIFFDDDVAAPDVDAARDIDAAETENVAMARMAQRASRKHSLLARIFIAAFTGFVTFAVGVYFWDFVASLLARNVVLGQIALVLVTILIIAVILYIIREIFAIWRLGRLNRLRQDARAARNANDLEAARKVASQLLDIYGNRRELAEGAANLRHEIKDQVDADQLLNMGESHLLVPLDAEASREIEAAARRVSVVTALVPLAFADVIVAMASNIGMIRCIAQIYGGRPGLFGGWRLFRAVMTHLVATGAVAVGDDMLGSVLGAGVLAKVSRRFGEGAINGALTVRVGLAAMEVCRPADFVYADEPAMASLLSRALRGFVMRGDT